MEVKKRSELYNLEPLGKGTPYIESLSSYIGRLSFRHCVHPGVLIRKKIHPFLVREDPEIAKRVKDRFYPASFAMNGIGDLANAFIGVTSRLTSRNDLLHTTMLKYSDLVSSNHLFRKEKAWCSECLKKMSLKGELYEPLLWNLEIVKICPEHNIPLTNVCCKCKNQNNIISAKTIPGYCSICFAWLGESNSEIIENMELHLKRATLVKDLLNWSQQYEKIPYIAEDFNKILNYIIEKVFKGHQAKAALELGYNWKTFNNWQTGVSKPPLEVLINICLLFHLSIEQLFNLKEEDSALHIKKDNDLLTRQHKKKKNIDQNKLKIVLDNIISQDSNVTLKSIGEMFGCSSSLLKIYFPAECRIIVERNKKKHRDGRNKRISDFEQKVEDAFFYLLKNGEYPSYRKMREQVGSHILLIPTVHQRFKDLKKLYFNS